MIDDHAQVFVGGMKVPLLGINPEATKEKCDRCGRQLHLTRIWMVDGRFMCLPCQAFSPIQIQLANSTPWRLNEMFGDRVR